MLAIRPNHDKPLWDERVVENTTNKHKKQWHTKVHNPSNIHTRMKRSIAGEKIDGSRDQLRESEEIANALEYPSKKRNRKKNHPPD